MKIYRFAEMIVRMITGINPQSKLLKLHQATNGWVVILRDEIDGQEYIGTFYPVKSERVVMPDTADQFLALTKKEEL